MQPKDKIFHIQPSCAKTFRGEPSFLQSSSTHLLYFNGCTVFLRPYNHSQPTLFITHNCQVTAAKFSYGYQHVASIDQKGTLQIHYVRKQGQQNNVKLQWYKTYQGFYLGGKAIDWTSDNKRICVVGSGKNRYGRVAAMDTGTDIGQITAVTANLTAVSFRPQKPYRLAAGGQQFTIKFYQGPPYKFMHSSKSHTNFINQILYSPDGKLIASVSSDRKIVLYDGLTLQIVKQLPNAHAGGITGVAWIDNETFVTCSSDKKLKKWNINLELQAEIQGVSNHEQLALIDSFVVAVTYCKEKEKIFYMLLSGEIKQADKMLVKTENSYEGHRSKPIKILSLNQKDQNNSIIIDSGGKILNLNMKTKQVHRYLKKNLCYNKLFLDASISPSGIIYYLTGEQQVHAIDTKSEQQKEAIKVEGAMLIAAIGYGFVACTREYLKVYELQGNGKFTKIGQNKLAFEPTFVTNNANNESKFDEIWIGSVKGNVQVFRLHHSEGAVKIQKVLQHQTNPNKITYIKHHNNLVFTGDSMGSIRVHKWHSLQSKIQQICDSMGSHTTMITSIQIFASSSAKQSHLIYTFSMDNKYSIWSLADFSRITTFVNVHKHGIVCGEAVDGSLVTGGGDLLVMLHQV